MKKLPATYKPRKEKLMYQFNYKNPTEVYFGSGRVKEIAQILKRFGKRTLIVTGRRHSQESGLVKRIEALCRESEIFTRTVSGVASNPTIEWVKDIVATLNKGNIDSIVAVGGGSVMDAAKIVSLALTHNGSIWEYRVTGSLSVSGISEKLIPVITIPTIAGTGSEISPAALITGANRKEVYFSPHMYPAVAIVDPELALSAPRKETAQTGMDAFVQALEAFVSPNSQHFSDMFAQRAMEIVYTTLPRLLYDLKNVEYRTEMALASMLSCYAIGQAGVGAVHALSDPLSGRHDLPHGLAVSILLPSVMKANMAKAPSKFVKLAEVLRRFEGKIGDTCTCEDAVRQVKDLVTRVGLSEVRLSDFGIKSSEFAEFVKETDNPDMSTNPAKLSTQEIVAIYESVL